MIALSEKLIADCSKGINKVAKFLKGGFGAPKLQAAFQNAKQAKMLLAGIRCSLSLISRVLFSAVLGVVFAGKLLRGLKKWQTKSSVCYKAVPASSSCIADTLFMLGTSTF